MVFIAAPSTDQSVQKSTGPSRTLWGKIRIEQKLPISEVPSVLSGVLLFQIVEELMTCG